MSGPDMRDRSECACCKSYGPKLRRYRKRGAFRGTLLCEPCRIALSIETSDREAVLP